MPNFNSKENIPGSVRADSNLPTEESDISGGEEVGFGLSVMLEDIKYPASREDILDYASDLGAEEVVLDMLEQLPDTLYNSPTDVSQALGENSEIMGP